MVILNNNTLTVKHDGVLYSKELSPEELIQVKVYLLDEDEQSIVDLCFATSKSLLKREGFWEENNCVYYKNIHVSIPQVLAEKLMAANEDEFQRLIKFWGWLSLNPNTRTIEELYYWVEKNGVQLTEGGLMVLYRRVISINSANTELGKFVREIYEKLRKQKKSTNVNVYEDEDGDYTLTSTYTDDVYNVPAYNDLVGNLKQLHLELDIPLRVFTDAHTRTKRYVIGEEARETREQGDENSSVSCSKGLHMSHKNYSFSGFGDTPIAVVVNPCDILAVPDNGEKIRSCAFTPVAILNKDAEWAEDKDVHQRIDACYDAAVERLETLLNETTFEDFKKHEILTNNWNLSVGFESVLKILNNN